MSVAVLSATGRREIIMAWYKVIFQSKKSFGFDSVAFETLDLASRFCRECNGFIMEYHEWINDKGHGFWKII